MLLIYICTIFVWEVVTGNKKWWVWVSQENELNRSEPFSNPRAAAADEVIRGWGRSCAHLGSKAGEGLLSAPGTLCRSLALPALHTMLGNPLADATWIVIEVKRTQWLFVNIQTLLMPMQRTYTNVWVEFWVISSVLHYWMIFQLTTRTLGR